jgi:L-2-hydroxyglutarate oxidase LhgO
MSERVDLVVVGAGIVGLAATRAVVRAEPGLKVVLVERHDRVAAGQSGHNSGVIHSGIYYKPGSLKARLCRAGRARLIDECQRRGIEHRVCGKIIVATDAAEVERLEALHERGTANGLEGLERLDPAAMRAIEPHVTGQAGLRVPEAGVVDYGEVCAMLASDLREAGVEIRLGWRVDRIDSHGRDLEVHTPKGRIRSRALLNCGGLYADEVARRAGASIDLRIIPFRGEYWILEPSRAGLVKSLIYPVPDPALPFLGVHLTRDVSGVVDAGPNAVLAFAREGYTRRDIDLGHLARTAAFVGTWRLFRRQWRNGLAEMRRSLDKSRLVADLQKLVPELRAEDLRPAPAGVRAQAVDPSGKLIDDFHFVEGPHAVHVLNAPSPAATASLAIGDAVAERLSASGVLEAPTV